MAFAIVACICGGDCWQRFGEFVFLVAFAGRFGPVLAEVAFVALVGFV